MSIYSRYLTLFALYISYMMHTYSRRSFQNVINYVLKEKYIDEDIVGIVITCQQIGYTTSKFVQPFILDKLNPKSYLVMTMVVSSVCLTLMSYASTLNSLSFLYWSHGFGLAFAWPSVAGILKSMISEEEFGFWWSILCTSSNMGAIFSSIISTLVADRFGWRMNLRFSASFNVISGLLISSIFTLYKVRPMETQKTPAESKESSGLRFRDILLNPILTLNSIMIFSVYLIRYVISDWYQVYLSTIHFSQISIASFIGMMEIGGIVGTILAGIVADFFYVHFNHWRNPRIYVLIIFGALTASVLHMLIFNVAENTSPMTLSSLGFLFGVFIYGPVTVSGIIAIEGVPRDKQVLSFSLNVIYANVAMLVAGYPIFHLGQSLGWKVSFIITYMGLIVSTSLLLLLRQLPTPIYDLKTVPTFQSRISII